MASSVLIYLGAHRGNGLAAHMNAHKEFTHIYAFEANEENVKELKERFKNDARVKIIHAAVCERAGNVMFNITNNNDSSSIGKFDEKWLEGRHDNIKIVKRVVVPGINLLQWCKENKIDRIESLMSDIQGYDLTALKTMTPMLQSKSILRIQCETTRDGCRNVYKDLPTNELSAFRALLEPLGYKLVATGWGSLVTEQFQEVDKTWWEFDAGWALA